MKTKALILALMTSGIALAQTNVTDTYLQNPDFEARYAGWLNEGTTKGQVGGFTHQVNSEFEGKSGELYMEKWVSSGSKVSDCNISQVIKGIPVGTYMLVCNAQNVQQINSVVQSGAFLFAGDEQTEVSIADEYSVTFSVVDGSVKVGFKTESATGNWVCVDNFRLYELDTDMEALHAQLQKLIDAANEVLGDGATAGELQAAISDVEELLSSESTASVEEAAKALERATLNYQISNGTGSVPTVETVPFIAQGATLALGRSNIADDESTLKEHGFCWSADNPEPTILDERTTEYFINNGYIYRMEGLEPATQYYMRAYAMTEDNQVGYGEVVRMSTKPMGTVTYFYFNQGSEEENYRIDTAVGETVWMYNHATHVTNVDMLVYYNSGVTTADCSYGGYMRVGPLENYQQTGTIVHETNHAVGVGTTNTWYNNSTLRENTTTGKWLGPCANEMVQFLQNDEKACMTGDTQHMWGTTTSNKGMKNWGINGASEDSYNPSDQLLYWGNIMITHAMHVDGLSCSSRVGFASPSYVFEQYDDAKYYIKSEDENIGLTKLLSHDEEGNLINVTAGLGDALEDDNLAWYITFNPETQYYMFRNAGSGKYLSLSSGKIVAGSSPSEFHLFPSRALCEEGDFSGHSYWLTLEKGSYALVGGASECSTYWFYNTDDRIEQRWLLLSEKNLQIYDQGVAEQAHSRLDDLIASMRTAESLEHVANDPAATVDEIDAEMENAILAIESEEASYTNSTQYNKAIATLREAMVKFITEASPANITEPFDVSCLLDNMAIDDNSGWSDMPTFDYSCCEYYTKQPFDFNQTTQFDMPAGTYELRAQAFQRPGDYEDVYDEYVKDDIDNVEAELYLDEEAVKVKNIYADKQNLSQGAGSIRVATRCYIPNTMQGAQNFFKNDLYENSVVENLTEEAPITVGLRCTVTSSVDYWTCFDNFRLLYYGGFSTDDVMPVEMVTEDEAQDGSKVYYDLSGRRVTKPTRGLYIHDGVKVLVK